MTIPSEPQRRFPDAREDVEKSDRVPGTPQTLHPSYRLAFSDADFLTRDELAPGAAAARAPEDRDGAGRARASPRRW